MSQACRSGAIAAACFALAACTSTTIERRPEDPAPAPGVAFTAPPTGEPDPAETPPGACPAVVTDATARAPGPRRPRSPVCTDADIDGLVVDLQSALIPYECGTCAGPSFQSEATWGATVISKGPNTILINVGACLHAIGENAACADAFTIVDLCADDACANCTEAEFARCRSQVAGVKGECSSLTKVKAGMADCTADLSAHLQTCDSLKTNLAFMCGGKPAPLGCGQTTANQVAAPVVGTAGVIAPSFAGGIVADGTYVATKVEGFGSGLGASVVGVTFKTTLTLAGTTYRGVSFNSADGKSKAVSGKQTATGTTLTQTQSCPTAQSLAQFYTATATTFVTGLGFGSASPNEGVVITYTKK